MNALSQSLRAAAGRGAIPVIPDFKRVSPKEGPLFAGRDPISWARQLERAGAPALSVVTEQAHFGGSMALLADICAAVSIPVLRKDFITGPDDLDATTAAGAQAILLICACLPRDLLARLYRAALDRGLEPLVEAHTPEELDFAGQLGAELVGLNNRDILDLERDGGSVSTTESLAARKPAGALLVSESGILTPRDVRAAMRAGADAVLVGTAIWRAGDPEAAYRALCGAGR
ncbi:MAG: indole-3-glycerol-phosphate synthase [Christensenellales bacterium]